MINRVVSAAVFTILLLTLPKFASSEEITVFPDSPSVGNCFPFGSGGVTPGELWTPYMGFIYQNIPPFRLVPGDTIAFDLGMMNGADVELDIELARASSNGSIDPEGPFTKVVSNAQTPLNPRGDDIVGDFEMQFTVQSTFNFNGGGLIVRFSNPSAAYQLYMQCDQVLVKADQSDASGFFVQRFYGDTDGLPPYDEQDGGAIGAIRIISEGGFPPIPTLSEWGMISAAVGLGLIGLFFALRKRTGRSGTVPFS